MEEQITDHTAELKSDHKIFMKQYLKKKQLQLKTDRINLKEKGKNAKEAN